jgi:hypothetical protein
MIVLDTNVVSEAIEARTQSGRALLVERADR